MHGWGGNISSFRFLAEPLSEEYRVLLPDLYGFGETPHPPHPLTIGDYAEGVSDLMTSLSIDECVLVGHSFGGRIAMRLASHDPRISGVVLIDSAGILPRRGIAYYLKVGWYKIGKKLRFRRLPKGSSDYAVLSGVMRKTFVNVVNESSERDARAITVPTLLIWGRSDKDTPIYMCKTLNRLIRGSECVLIEGGHFAYLEHPMLMYRVLRAYRERI